MALVGECLNEIVAVLIIIAILMGYGFFCLRHYLKEQRRQPKEEW